MAEIYSSLGKLAGGSSACPSLLVGTFITHCAVMKEKDLWSLTTKKFWLMDSASKLQPFISSMDAIGMVVLVWESPVTCILEQWLSKTNSKHRIECGFGLGMLLPRVVNPPTHSKIHSLSALHRL